jgi:hypothetical protein
MLQPSEICIWPSRGSSPAAIFVGRFDGRTRQLILIMELAAIARVRQRGRQ